MNEETTQLIQQLADKLGTTSEYLWGTLIRQAKIDSIVTLFQFLLIGIFGYVIFRIHKSLSIKKDYDGYSETGYQHYQETASIFMIISVCLFVMLLIASFFSIPDLVSGFLNPEYWALKEILKSIK